LNFEPVSSGTSGALIATLKGAYDRKEPVMGWGYDPHWFIAKADGGFVEFPAFDPKCHSDPSWGPIKDKTHDCSTAAGYLWKMMNRDLANRAPLAARVFYLFRLDAASVAEGMEKIDVKGMSYDDMAKEWLAANEATWRKWLR